MRAAVRDRFGSPDVVQIREIEKPAPAADEILVRVRATSVNPSEWYSVAGRPWVARLEQGLRRPKTNRLGVDYAGTVEAVGANVTAFQPRDDVFGGRSGAFAEYVCPKVDKNVVRKPGNMTFEQAAAVPTAAVTALQGLRDHGRLQPGQKVLINGASGGVGTFAVQIAKALGAEVTAVCGTDKVELARTLGADRVVDYTQDDFTRSGDRYDLLLDVAGSRSWSEYRRVLARDGALVIVGGPKRNRLLGPLSHVIKIRLASLRSSQRIAFFIAKFSRPDFELLRELLESGAVKPVIDRQYELSEIADALRYLGEGHAGGKVVVTV
jgi:NADPH:quinone reductase-like Zn-dependent oxidoreductase